ncbi:hypothetical protein CAC42_1691 [Sphaceloma murrayae]|uniref:CYTH domain-containing protein n=1 Tax=Sphaceloma murrayae TaxID=2082308 RepID=A0A2K1QIF3_9PEZI|nr:hypothetical protein CAC42_1691 [Sphaceloma murrayae]
MSSVRTAVLEVERKFTSLSPLFATNAGPVPFLSLHRLPDRRFVDVYLDTPGTASLFKKGMYLRLRNGEWQAKLPVSGQRIFSDERSEHEPDGATTRFEEVHGQEDVELRLLPMLEGQVKTLGELERVARFRTHRKGWVVDGEFKVVWDQTCFGHGVGEVEYAGGEGVGYGDEEVRREVGGYNGAQMPQGPRGKLLEKAETMGLSKTSIGTSPESQGTWARVMGELGLGNALDEPKDGHLGAAAASAEEKLDGFMRRYEWAFGQGVAKGKLRAYFEKYGFPKGWERVSAKGWEYGGWAGVMDYGI